MTLVVGGAGALAFWVDTLAFPGPHVWATLLIPLGMIIAVELWRQNFKR
jgi:hypothetical protein